MFILNRWYVAGWSKELSDKPLARTLLDEPVVLFRTQDGLAVALEDRCCHRNLPLSHGRVEGNTIACGYHGMVYEPGGRCIKVPGQEGVPANACVRSFPVAERDAVVWIWLGDVEKADVAKIPSYPIHGDPLWAHQTDHYVIQGNHELINDNLIDLSHVGYVHGKTIGGTPEAHSDANLKLDRTSEGCVVRRWMPNSVPPPTYVRAVGFEGRIDRWMEITFIPGLIRIYIGANNAGVGLDEAGHMDKLGIWIFNGITPETATSTHYFWSAAHNFKVDQPEVTKAFHCEIAATFVEDRVVVEAQQERFTRFPNRRTVLIKSDAGGVHARRVIAEQLALEAHAAASVEVSTAH
jgi:phenylpropionate dioxygenase-like ring-hydroxylating dioxygenase large terminal subunit